MLHVLGAWGVSLFKRGSVRMWAGLWVLVSMLALLKHCDLDHLKTLAVRIPYLSTA